MRLRLLPEAEEEIRAAAQWYEDRETGLGEQFLAAVVDALLAVQQHPRRFAHAVRAPARREVRRFLLNRFPYAVIYDVRPEESVVLAVSHAQRRPGYWRERPP